MTRVTSVLKRGPWRYLSDRDVLLAAAVTALAMAASGGLVWVGYWLHVWWVARASPLAPGTPMAVLVFGRRLVDSRPEHDFEARLERALALVRSGHGEALFLLGGHGGGRVSEAAAGAQWLHQRGLPPGTRLVLEQASVDSLENLRHARSLMQHDAAGVQLPPVALVTSRYHLARCQWLARRLGFQRCEPVAAEVGLRWDWRLWKRLAAESGYLMWIDLGWRWARLMGHERILARLS